MEEEMITVREVMQLVGASSPATTRKWITRAHRSYDLPQPTDQDPVTRAWLYPKSEILAALARMPGRGNHTVRPLRMGRRRPAE